MILIRLSLNGMRSAQPDLSLTDGAGFSWLNVKLTHCCLWQQHNYIWYELVWNRHSFSLIHSLGVSTSGGAFRLSLWQKHVADSVLRVLWHIFECSFEMPDGCTVGWFLLNPCIIAYHVRRTLRSWFSSGAECISPIHLNYLLTKVSVPFFSLISPPPCRHYQK